MNDFSTHFIHLRDQLYTAWSKDLQCCTNEQVCGRMTALYAWFDSNADVALLGLVKTGRTTHSHEYRMVISVPQLDETKLDDCWQYALKAQEELVCIDENHNFSLISLIVVTDTATSACKGRLRKMQNEVRYQKGVLGWSSVRVAVASLSDKKLLRNSMGAPLCDMVKPLL